MRVLVVEDDAKTASSLELYLRSEGYDVTVAGDGPRGLAAARSGKFDLLLLDLMLPGMYGMDVCRELRAESQMPIIMITARTLEDDQIRGLDLGADDYITKPFSPRQVMARVRSVLRRHKGAPEITRVGELSIDHARHEVRVGERAVDLTRTELRLLEFFVASDGRAVTRSQIVSAALDDDFDGSDRTVDVHVKNLRRKLGDEGARIETLHGVGYRMRLE